MDERCHKKINTEGDWFEILVVFSSACFVAVPGLLVLPAMAEDTSASSDAHPHPSRSLLTQIERTVADSISEHLRIVLSEAKDTEARLLRKIGELMKEVHELRDNIGTQQQKLSSLSCDSTPAVSTEPPSSVQKVSEKKTPGQKGCCTSP